MIFSAGSVSFTKAQLKALIAHSSTDIARPHVNAVHFDARTLRAVSTDGHRLAILDGEGVKGEWSYLMPRESGETALRAKGAETFILDTVRGDVCAFDKANRKVGTFEAAQPKHADTKDEKGNVVPGTVFAFPPYQQVATAPTVGGERRRQGFNAGYLSDVALVAAAAANPRTLGVTFYPGEGELDPGIFVAGKWTVYIMPMRTGDESTPKSKRGKASQPVQDAPSAAIVLAGGPVDVATVETPQNAKGAPSVIVLDTRPVNAASLGSDLAPIALLAARKASREREWRETFAITAETPRDVLAAWVEDAA